MDIEFQVDTPAGPHSFVAVPGETIFFVGANGSGKTRLAAAIEEKLGDRAHRISAHRALSLDLKIPKISRRQAENMLFTGYVDGTLRNRAGSRWGSKKETHLLNDYGALLQVLFAEQNDTALQTHKANRRGDHSAATLTRFETLVSVWERLITHRKLTVTGDAITVVSDNGTTYTAEEMSDGERAVFYLIGQALCAASNSLIVFDEPELHVHRSILAKLWDELQALRPDCPFLLISHDLEFVASRSGRKYVIEAFDSPANWTLTEVPEETGFSEELNSLILGSRRPILFVEGTADSLDVGVYRAVYYDWTVIPRGGCDEVISSVRTMKANARLTRVQCAGIVDADDRALEEITNLNGDGIFPLSVSELENIVLLESVATVVCELEALDASAANTRITSLKSKVFEAAASDASKNAAVIRHVRRRIDREMKSIDLSEAKTPTDLACSFSSGVAAIDVGKIAADREAAIDSAVSNENLTDLLAIFDDKGMFATAARVLTEKSKKTFERWLARHLRQSESLREAFKNVLPRLPTA